MKNRLPMLALIAVLLLSGLRMFAQEDESNPLVPKTTKKPIYPGIVIGYNQTMHSVDLSSIPQLFTQVPCPKFQNGNASGFFAGICWEYFFGDAATTNSSIVGRLMYNTMPASFQVAGDEMPSAVFLGGPTQPPTIIPSTVDHNMSVVYTTFTLDLLYKLDFYRASFGAFGLYVGPTFDFAITKTWEQEMDLVSPQNAVFHPDSSIPPAQRPTITNNGRTEVFKSGTIDGSQSFRLGMKVGLLYELLLKNGFYLVPNVCYNYGITKLTSNENWHVNALQFALDLRYAIKL